MRFGESSCLMTPQKVTGFLKTPYLVITWLEMRFGESSCLMTPSYHAYWHLNRKLLIDTFNFFFFFCNWELQILWNTSSTPSCVLLKYWKKIFNINRIVKLQSLEVRVSSCLMTPSYHAYWYLNRKLLIDTFFFFFFFCNWELQILWNTSSMPSCVLLKYWKKIFNINRIVKLQSLEVRVSSCLMTPSYHAYWYLNRKLLIDTFFFFFFFFCNWELQILWNTSSTPSCVLLKYWKKIFNINRIVKLQSLEVRDACLMTPSYHAYWHLNRKLLIDTFNFFFLVCNWELKNLWNTSSMRSCVL